MRSRLLPPAGKRSTASSSHAAQASGSGPACKRACSSAFSALNLLISSFVRSAAVPASATASLHPACAPVEDVCMRGLSPALARPARTAPAVSSATGPAFAVASARLLQPVPLTLLSEPDGARCAGLSPSAPVAVGLRLVRAPGGGTAARPPVQDAALSRADETAGLGTVPSLVLSVDRPSAPAPRAKLARPALRPASGGEARVATLGRTAAAALAERLLTGASEAASPLPRCGRMARAQGNT
mmetsp:Transcript_86547/g.242382  ORF Transcript_86547/g.242382 Transcript_86547/m.242382 type:complete len:243 (-) Transcript_86547:19-747(-)